MTTSVTSASAFDIWEKSKSLITKDCPNWATQSYCSSWCPRPQFLKQWVRMSPDMSWNNEVTKKMATVKGLRTSNSQKSIQTETCTEPGVFLVVLGWFHWSLGSEHTAHVLYTVYAMPLHDTNRLFLKLRVKFESTVCCDYTAFLSYITISALVECIMS